MNTSAVFFETSRLVVRTFSPADVEAFVAYRADPEVARYQSWSDYTLERGRDFVESLQGAAPGEPGEWFQLALEDRASGTLVGDLALHVDAQEPRQAEVGFTLAADHQGHGYATEALTGFLGWAFETFGLHRVVAVTDVLNTSSVAVLERVGLRREAHFHENIFFKGAWGSEFLFAILEREWAARS
jgi:RimJ/RimL family protein N-acetyltransferase